MTMQEQWLRWEPSLKVANSYIFEKISEKAERSEKFNIELIDNLLQNKKLKIKFKDGVLAYRLVKNEFRQQTLIQLQSLYDAEYLNWPFFKVQNSTYIEWLTKQACNIYPPEDFVHYVFLTKNYTLDVIDSSGPEQCFFAEESNEFADSTLKCII